MEPNENSVSQLATESGVLITAASILLKTEAHCGRAALGIHLIIGGVFENNLLLISPDEHWTISDDLI